MLGLGISSSTREGGGANAVVIEDYLWSSTDSGTAITPRFADVRGLNVQDLNDAWDAGGVTDWSDGDPGRGMMDGASNDGAASINELMPSTDATSGNSQAYLSDDEGYWVVSESSSFPPSDGHDSKDGQDGDADTELTPIATGNFPIGDGNYVA
jgi:hypothetical protein